MNSSNKKKEDLLAVTNVAARPKSATVVLMLTVNKLLESIADLNRLCFWGIGRTIYLIVSCTLSSNAT